MRSLRVADGIENENEIGMEESVEEDRETATLLPRLSNPDPLYSFLEIEKNNKASVLQIGITILSFSLSGVPYIQILSDMPVDLGIYKYPLIVSTFLNLGFSRSWVFSEIFKPKQKFPRKTPNGLIISSHLLGVVSALPYTYAIYKFNPIKALCLIEFLVDYGLGTYGYYNVLKHFRPRKGSIGEISEESVHFRNGLDILFSRALDSIDNTSRSLSSLRSTELRGLNDEIEFLFQIIQRDKKRIESAKSIHQQSLLYTGYCVSLALTSLIPVAVIFKNTALSWESSRLLWDNPFFSTIYTVVTVVPGFSLDLYTTSITTQNIYKSLLSFHEINTTENFLLTVGSLVPSSLYATLIWFLTYYTLEDSSLKDFALLFTICNFLGNIIFESFATREIASGWISYSRKDTEHYQSLYRSKKTIEVLNEIDNKEAYEYIDASIDPILRGRVIDLSREEEEIQPYNCIRSFLSFLRISHWFGY